ncbi:MAG: YihA family ribosome biogenesis GTP-binding protein [Deltaproteobacteria bacterium]|jgi:GTP-binding protein|nr:YihA family ribosome biogenesis GTP-binding protein [Deltaproteobacteria bacterium]MBT4525133.1 YihA family ribosome biogenesis GTP-binding protein [Deltaproteobacteria bacterium]
MIIKSAEYVKSLPDIKQLDIAPLPGIAFVGRSNVGKSSLINHLLNRKNLVKTSSTPGKTQLINFFIINSEFYFIDLPGYGFANVPVKVKQSWMDMIQNFLFSYSNLKTIIQLVDIRHKPSNDDITFQKMLRAGNLDYLVVANKVDKVKKNQIPKTLKTIQQTLSIAQKPMLHSSLKKVGKTEIWSILNKKLTTKTSDH